MKKVLFLIICMFAFMHVSAQVEKCDSVFREYVYNDEYKVYIDMDFVSQKVRVPGQDIFGDVPGYLGAVRDSRKWLVTSVDMLSAFKAELSIVNDYGSEDLTATLVYNPANKTYVLRQTGGSRLKIAVNRKWVKLPLVMTFLRHGRVAAQW